VSAGLLPVGFLVKFGIGELSENRENPNFVKTGKKYLAICTKNKYVLLLQATYDHHIDMLTAIRNGATQNKCVFAFPWQRLCDNTEWCVTSSVT
jgi:hypothetical protein